MIAYIIFFIIPSIFAAAEISKSKKVQNLAIKNNIALGWLLTTFALTLVIGLRYEVGGDWYSYVGYVIRARDLTILEMFEYGDPAYWAINKISLLLGLDITGVNLISAFIFSIGLTIFCLNLPRPWLALTCAMPYLVTVVAMGYTRQSVAVSLTMVALVLLSKHRFLYFAVAIFFAAMFHKSAIIVLPVAVLTMKRRRVQAAGLTLIIGVLGYEILISDFAPGLITEYLDNELQSSGALIRLVINVIPAIIYLVWRKRFQFSPEDDRIWGVYSLLSITLLLILFLTDASTAVDRVALYLIPLQLVIFSNIPDLHAQYRSKAQIIVTLIVFYYGTILVTWLNFAVHARYWLPYQVGW